MKWLLLVLSFALVFTAGEGLKCYKCLETIDSNTCNLKVEECQDSGDVCVTTMHVTFGGPVQSCLPRIQCTYLEDSGFDVVHCCKTDLCNKV
ncbi:lymphocyte antigen 6S-like [Syngnathoides biaculeatus]|uniref:lymphocyte antigen 6S-like n=1 Tax=Syngnathoides biaculeatus TaxID=300417 RepID=UPI002ADDEEF4|nr:lymphocyte antigen 6S-like [Syngnathoides biaculeatus]